MQIQVTSTPRFHVLGGYSGYLLPPVNQEPAINEGMVNTHWPTTFLKI